MKACSKCKVEKPKSDFNKNKSKKDGLSPQCKPCIKETMSVYYQANKEAFVERARRLEHELSLFVRELKDNPCMDCGNKFHFAAMDFDHRGEDEKLGNVSRMVSLGSKKKILEEVAKCDLVCSNCHRVRTWTRLVSVKESHVPL